MFELAGDDVAGEASGRLTNVYGYAGFPATEKIDVWGIFGYGAGELKILQEDEPALATDLGMRMVATGLRGELPSPDWGIGIALAVKADAMWVQSESDAVGDLVDARGEATRLRLALEGSRALTLRDGTLSLKGEIGLRHDGGDADTGAGLQIGGGFRYAIQGYTIDGSAHGIVAHGERGFGEWGVSGSIRIDPGTPGSRVVADRCAGLGRGAGRHRAPGRPIAKPQALDRSEASSPKAGWTTEVGYGVTRAPRRWHADVPCRAVVIRQGHAAIAGRCKLAPRAARNAGRRGYA